MSKPSSITVNGKLLTIVVEGKLHEFLLPTLSDRLKMATQQQLENERTYIPFKY